ncbi:MAG: ParB/RepB/Spo0J family partition protein [Oscillospiraceae bacterium]
MAFNLGTSNNSGKLRMSGFLSNDSDNNSAVEMDIPIEQLVPWDNQPFKMYNDFKLNELAESIKENGLLSRIIVYPISDGKYRIIAGHNRVEACKLAGISTIPSIVKHGIDDNRAKLIMVDTNLCQRMEFLPSERAYAYKAQQEALIALGSPRATSDIAEKYGENRRTIQRYIACSRLTPKLMDMLDEGRITVRVGEKLSTMPEVSQNETAAYLRHNPNSNISDDGARAISEKKFISEKEIETIITSSAPQKTKNKSQKAEDKVVIENSPEAEQKVQERATSEPEDEPELPEEDVPTKEAVKPPIDDSSRYEDITFRREEINEIIGDNITSEDVANYLFYCLQRRDIFTEWIELNAPNYIAKK